MQLCTDFDVRQFRNALAAYATGVAIITTRTALDRTRIGVTVNSFNSVSVEPPMVLWSLAKSAHSRPAFEVAEFWCVHILSERQDNLANRFASPGVDKFSGIETVDGLGGTPLLAECAAWLQCRSAFKYEGGDHIILVGEVLALERNSLPALVFHDGRYAVTRPHALDIDTE